MSFERLFTPLSIGSMTIPNRIVMAPHGVSFLSGYGSGVERVINYHIERARGGAGLIVMSNFLMPEAWRKLGSWGGNLSTTPFGNLDLVSDTALIPSYRAIAEGVHSFGAKFVSQLNASGRQHYSPGMASFGIPLWAPSPLPCPKTGQIPKEMEAEDIEEYIDIYAKAAMNMQEAGADGVEVFAAQGYLLHEFLSPATNKRSDQYGGSLENRMRFLNEVIDAIRKAVGSDFVVGVRMNGDDFSADGITPLIAQEIAKTLAARGLVDYLNVSGMTYAQYPGWIADMTTQDAPFADAAGRIKKAVPHMPICVVSRIGSPELAEDILATGNADMIGMVRALISDPELPNKARRGDSPGIRRCTYSNQSCLMGLDSGRGVGCLHNVAVGREAQLGIGRMRPAPRGKRVVVIGGGPAGMAAARVSIERGHDVTLIEKDGRLGGQNLMTASMAHRKGFGEVTRWQEHMLRRSTATLQLGSEATVDGVIALQPDAVIVATGSVPLRTGRSRFRPEVGFLPGVDQDNVFTVWDVFRQLDAIGRNVVIIDEDPHLSGAYVAEYLAGLGRTVRILTPQIHPAHGLHVNFVPDLYRRLGPLGVVVSVNSLATAIEGRQLQYKDRYSGKKGSIKDVDSVILAMGNEVENRLYRELKSKVPEIHAVGDCVAPRRIDDAILDGERSAWML